MTEEIHKQILYFIEEPEDTDPKTLVGYKRKEYKRYQQFLTKKQKPAKVLKSPFIPESLLAKRSIFNYQEIIDYFKNLHSSESQ
ncbi:hypothetical protein OVS_00885 [Mycoplasma ovis str. Michigan]|uniref:Uncharacterized protein n=1 Tax=Mycoplasma ovis str. Michigan TaxID=1415773 RepID=A0ABM5P146_9MOLU|nr:hypothetical protein [Mycoplasma ovis]AHC40161.1 hypothetical protein OVS_00885 [Mycoplasma ovis str. Michigan]